MSKETKENELSTEVQKNELEELSESISASSSEEVQRQMLEKAQEASEDTFGMAAKVYDHLKYKFREQVGMLKNRKQVQKLLLALAEYPIQDQDTNFMSDFEKDSFIVGHELLSAKYIMLFHHNLETATEKQKAMAMEEAAKQNNEENNSNGET